MIELKETSGTKYDTCKNIVYIYNRVVQCNIETNCTVTSMNSPHNVKTVKIISPIPQLFALILGSPMANRKLLYYQNLMLCFE